MAAFGAVPITDPCEPDPCTANITISKKNLHHQLEFELRSKLIHLREEYLHFRGKDLENLILSSIPALTPIIGALLYLMDIYSSKIDLFKAVSDAYMIDTGILKEVSDIRRGNAKFNKDKEIYIRDLIKVMTGLGRIVDRLNVE